MLTEKELARKRQNLHFAIQLRKYLPLIFLYSCFLFVMIPTAFLFICVVGFGLLSIYWTKIYYDEREEREKYYRRSV